MKRVAAGYLRGERPEHTLQPTALVHETYLRMVHLHSPKIENRKHFLVLAAQAMRRVLVDHARRHNAGKRDAQLLPPDSGLVIQANLDCDMVALDAAGRIETDTMMRTSLRGVFAAGDIRRNSVALLAAAAGDGATAAIAAFRYLRNERGATSIAAFSPRARAGVPVALPLSWSELKSKQRPRFLVSEFSKWKKRLANDPWKGMQDLKQQLKPSKTA